MQSLTSSSSALANLLQEELRGSSDTMQN